MKHKQTSIAVAVALALAQTTGASWAQQTDKKDADKPAVKVTDKDKQKVETVVVTGIRASLERSLDVKRNADTHVDVITAEDIGKMPDKNVADSLQRVPGVTISSAGATEGGFDENDRVSLRGTNPSLTQTLINGHNIASGDWFVLNQAGTVGRSVSYTLLPSELVGQVIIHKSSEASLVEGGVAGSVNIVTRKPLDFRKPVTMEASLGMVRADLPKKSDPQVSALINWKNDANTAGVLLQGFSEKRHLRRDGVEVLRYEIIAPGSAVATARPDLSGVFYPGLMGAALFEQERERTGGLIDVQIKPSRDVNLSFSAFSSKLDAANYNRNYLLWGTRFINGGAGQAPDPGYVVRNNTLVSASFTGVPGTQYGIYDQISRPDESADSNFFAFDGRFRIDDKLAFNAKAGTSKGHGKTPTQDVAEWDFGVGSGASYRLNGIDRAPDFRFGNINNANTSAVSGLDWIFGSQNVNVVDKENWAQLDGEYTLDGGAITMLKFGARANTHERSSVGNINQRPSLNGSAFNSANWPTGFTNYPGNFGSGLGGDFPRNVWYYTAEQLAAFNAAHAYRPTDGSRNEWGLNFGVKETNTAAYVQANFEGAGWAGNAGVRLVQTKEHVLNYNGVSAITPGAITSSLFGPYVIAATDHTYRDVLPSANLKLNLGKDLVARFAVSKTMTRADYSALASSVNLAPPAVATGVGTGSGGNPDLKPIRSSNFDATLEYYFAPRALAQATLFHMKLDNYIGLGQVTKNFVTFSTAFPNGRPTDYVLSVPVNSKGKVTGIELSYEQPILGNFGVAANYTYADAEEQGGGPLVGASRNVYNLSGYYEDDRFSARVNYTFRSSFYSGLDRNTAFYQDDTDVVSASFGYKVNDHLTVTLDGMNLNNPKLKYFALNNDQPRSIYQNGRQFYLMARFKF
ncbi:MAG: TonB-dependent receptor [Betaproteobacteria bacterium]|nr:TonB-dependent receptor [Betaproteobacteria bacterium]